MDKEVNIENLTSIWTRFQLGDKEAFAVLYNLNIDALYHYGTKLCKDDATVKDALQELFLELFLNRYKIKVNPENLKFYLLLALKRNLIKKIKSDRKLIYGFNEGINFEPEYSIEYQIIKQEKDMEINQKVLNAISLLPSKQKEAVYLRFNESLEYSEIAGILEITVESARKQVHRALKKVRELIGKETNAFLFVLLLKKS